MIANVVDVVAVDDHTVRLVLGAPQASLLTKTLERSSGRAMTIVSRRALEELGESQYGLTPVGTGPFRVSAHTMGQSVVLERFADYYDPERPEARQGHDHSRSSTPSRSRRRSRRATSS